MEFRHLRYFVTVADELHFSRAAARLGMAQPPLSQQIHQLEKELDVALFHRNRRRHVELTEAGKALLPHARKILADVEHLPALARQAAVGDSGFVSVGFTGGATYLFLPTLLRRFRDVAPQVELELRDMGPPQQLEALQSRKLHVAFVRATHQSLDALSDLAYEPVLHEAFEVALPTNHPLAREAYTPLPLTELAAEPFLLFGRPTLYNLSEVIIGSCVAAGFQPRVVQHVSELQTLLALVAAGLGIGLVPASVKNVQRSDIVLRPIAEPAPQTELLMVWNRNETAPAGIRFMDVARQVAKALAVGVHPANLARIAS